MYFSIEKHIHIYSSYSSLIAFSDRTEKLVLAHGDVPYLVSAYFKNKIGKGVSYQEMADYITVESFLINKRGVFDLNCCTFCSDN